MAKLKVGDKIRIVGWPMLAKLRDGMIFKVLKIYDYHGSDAYDLKSGRTRVGHYVSNIDMSIHEDVRGFNNRIEIVS